MYDTETYMLWTCTWISEIPTCKSPYEYIPFHLPYMNICSSLLLKALGHNKLWHPCLLTGYVNSGYPYTVKCCYNTVQFVTILHKVQRLQWEKVNRIMEPQQTPLYFALMGELWGMAKLDHYKTKTNTIWRVQSSSFHESLRFSGSRELF